MPRQRQIYQTDIVYVGPTGAFPVTGALFNTPGTGGAYGTTPLTQFTGSNLVGELFRVQSVNYDWNKTLKDVNQFGELAAIDRVPLDQPTVTAQIVWLLANLNNEERIGLTVSKGNATTSCISGLLNNTTDGKNYFFRTVGEGNDAVGTNESSSSVVAIGNGFISSYTHEAAVGDFPRSTVNIEGLNIEWINTNSGDNTPAVNPSDGSPITGWFYALATATENVSGVAINATNQSLSVLRPGDILLNLGLGAGDGGFAESDLKAQNYSLSFNMNRQNLLKLGSKYAFAKVIQFPLTATLSVTANVGDFQTGSLVEIVNNNVTFNPTITLRKPGTTTDIAKFALSGAKLDSQGVTSSIGPNKAVTMQFTTQIGGPQSINGLVISGITA